MKKTFTIILNTLIVFILISCNKKEVKPTTTQPTSTTITQTKVWCFYQTNFGNKAFLYCAKSESEKNTKINDFQASQLQFIIEEKTSCNQCQ